MRQVILTVFFLSLYALLPAQEKFLRHYSVNEGLPSSETYAVFQDSKGFIWIASDMGVSRFDGYNFKVFTTANGLTDNTVFKFYEDYKGRIWFNTFSGLLCYYYNDTVYGKKLAINEQFRSFIGPGSVYTIHVDTRDTVIISTNNGLVRLVSSNPKSEGSWDKMEILDRRDCVLMDSDRFVFEQSAGKGTGITRYMRNGSNTRTDLNAQPFRSLASVYCLRDRSVLMGFNVFAFIIDTFGKVKLKAPIPFVYTALQEGDSTIWLGSNHGGANLFSINDLSRPLKTLLKPFSVTCILKDRESGYWFTTLEDGLFYLPSAAVNSYAFPRDSMGSPIIAFRVMGKNKLWAFTEGEIYEKDKGLEFKEILKGLPQQYTNIGWVNVLWNAFVRSDGHYLVSTNCGIINVDPVTYKAVGNTYLRIQKNFPSYDSRLLIEDHDGNIWSLNHQHVIKLDKSCKIIKSFLVPAWAEAICEDDRGRILLGTVSGLYNLVGDSFVYAQDQYNIFRNRVVDLKKSGNTIIGATRGAGIFIYSGDSIYRITSENGLRSDMCRSVFVDKQNTIWVATNNGLNSIRYAEHPFKVSISSLSVADGLPSDDIAHVEKDENILWLLTKKGVCSLDPDALIVDSIPPPVYITGLKIDNAGRSLQTTHEFDSKVNFIAIDYVGLTYKNAGKQNYKYKLEGYDTSWTYTKNTFVQFTKLPPGNYKFIVSCINNSGAESTVPAFFKFKVNAPFYKRWWFYISVSLLFAALVVLASLLAVRRIREREKTKTEINRKLANLELQALRAQMNPHFIFNCLNAIQDFILKNEPIPAKHYLSSFSKLIRKTLDNSRRPNIPLIDEVDFLYLYLELERMRVYDKFDYHITLEPGIKDMNLEIPSMILQPFIENAVRHSKIGSLPVQGLLKIDFLIRSGNLVCKIDDNGVGVNQSLKERPRELRKGNAHAMDIINDRVRTINEVQNLNIGYTVNDKSDLGSGESGTMVEVVIPLQTMD